MRTLIKGGTIVTAEQEFVGDILVEGEIIRAMGAHLDEKADRVIDAQGKYVFPGGVDQHTHFPPCATWVIGTPPVMRPPTPPL